jgi:hypothetical protein
MVEIKLPPNLEAVHVVPCDDRYLILFTSPHPFLFDQQYYLAVLNTAGQEKEDQCFYSQQTLRALVSGHAGQRALFQTAKSPYTFLYGQGEQSVCCFCDRPIADHRKTSSLGALTAIGTRLTLGLKYVESEQLVLLAHYKYLSDGKGPSVVLDFYRIQGDGLVSSHQLTLPGGTTCNNTEGRLGQQIKGENLLLTWGDLYNDDSVYMTTGTSQGFSAPIRVNLGDADPTVDFPLGDNLVISSLVVGFDQDHPTDGANQQSPMSDAHDEEEEPGVHQADDPSRPSQSDGQTNRQRAESTGSRQTVDDVLSPSQLDPGTELVSPFILGEAHPVDQQFGTGSGSKPEKRLTEILITVRYDRNKAIFFKIFDTGFEHLHSHGEKINSRIIDMLGMKVFLEIKCQYRPTPLRLKTRHLYLLLDLNSQRILDHRTLLTPCHAVTVKNEEIVTIAQLP